MQIQSNIGNAFNPLHNKKRHPGLNAHDQKLDMRGGQTATAAAAAAAAAANAPSIPSLKTSTAPAKKKKRKKKTTTAATAPSPPPPKAKTKNRKVTSSKPQIAAPASSSPKKKVKSKNVEQKPQVVKSTAPTVEKPAAPKESEPSPKPIPVPLPLPVVENKSEESSGSGSVSRKNKNSHNTMPSIFTKADEAQYDTYSACLAATESLRRMRDSTLKNKRGSTAVGGPEEKSWKSLLKGPGRMVQNSGGESGADGEAVGREEYKRACAEYVLNSSKAIKALGLSVSQFNQLGREVAKNPALKEKVMEQAYLYRMASTIKMDKIPLIQDPDSKQLLKSTRRRRVQMFVKSITEIEELREEQTARLRRALNIDKLPKDLNLCDPNVLPLLSPQVRSVIEAFPLQAEEIVKKYGLNSDEFNQMLEETRGNPVFRWRVQRFRNKQEE